MPIAFTCRCGRSYDLPDSRLGQTFRCPHCFDLQTCPAPVARPSRQWPQWATTSRLGPLLALFLLVPGMGTLGVWLLLSGRSEATATETPAEVASPKPDMRGQLGAVEKPLEPVAAVDPEPIRDTTLPSGFRGPNQPLGAIGHLLNSVNDDPHFIDPGVNERLTLIHRMVQAYNHRG